MWGVAFTDLAGIFAERYVADVMASVFNAPVATPPIEQLSRICQVVRHTGDGIVDLDGLFFTLPRCPNDAANLRQPGPIAVLGQS